MDPELRRALQQYLGSPVQQARPVTGGDINQAFCVGLADGRRAFVKTRAGGPADLFSREADGLAWLAAGLSEARALRVPGVLAARPPEDGVPGFLALDWIERGAPGTDYEAQLGHDLAALHRSGAPYFGLHHDNYIATLHQRNQPSQAWPQFYADARLHPLLVRAVDRGLLGRPLRVRFERLLVQIATRCGPPEPPARLHGDLWGGNVFADRDGGPVLFDPAVYGGHREIDLAMMHLFGGFGPRCFAAYDEAYPLAPEHRGRVPLYQLYPLLVHVNLFGAGYVANLECALDQVV